MKTDFTVTQQTHHKFKDINITAQFSDTIDGFAFRLVQSPENIGKWTLHYESFARLTIGTRNFRLGSSYWEDSFPSEIPFELVLQNNS
jgi:hypothetical protein